MYYFDTKLKNLIQYRNIFNLLILSDVKTYTAKLISDLFLVMYCSVHTVPSVSSFIYGRDLIQIFGEKIPRCKQKPINSLSNISCIKQYLLISLFLANLFVNFIKVLFFLLRSILKNLLLQ